MNLKDRLRHLAVILPRDSDFSIVAAVCKLARESHGVVITDSFATATHLQRKHGVVAKSYEINLEDLPGPFYVDPYAIKEILEKAANKIESLEADLALEQLKNKGTEYEKR